MHHRFNGATHEDGRVVDNFVVHALREALLQLGHASAHRIGNLDGVGAGTLEHRDGNRRLVVEQGAQGVLAGAQFNACDVFQTGDFTVFTGANDDVLELFLADQTALGVDRQLEAVASVRGWRTERAGSYLAVLLANGIDHVTGGQAP